MKRHVRSACCAQGVACCGDCALLSPARRHARMRWRSRSRRRPAAPPRRCRAADAGAAAAAAAARARPRSPTWPRACSSAVVNISTSQNVKGTEGPGAVPMPQAAGRLAVPGFLRRLLQGPRRARTAATAEGAVARLRLRRRRRAGHRRHQQPRHRRRRRDRGQFLRRLAS